MGSSLDLGFGGRGFESSVTLFSGGCGFSVHIFFRGVVGLSPHLCFSLVGVFFLNFVLFGWWWWFYFHFLGDYFFKGIFLKFFLFVLCWKCIYICLTFTQSFTQFFFVMWGSVSVGRCAFLFLGTNM